MKTILLLSLLSSLLLPAVASSASALKLNGLLITGGDVTHLAVSPNSIRVVYRADQESNDVFELFSVPITGGMPVKLSGPMTTGGDVSSDFRISPDSQHVVYLADQEANEVYELYTVPIAGGTPQKLNLPFVDGDVTDYAISADSTRVVFRAAEWSHGARLYSVPVAGGVPRDITVLPGLTADVLVNSFVISADSTRVVYRSAYDSETNASPTELYSTDIATGFPVKLNGALVEGGLVRRFALSPDSSRVTYVADQETDNVDELFSVPIQGGNAVKLNSALMAGQTIYSGRFSPDSSRVVFDLNQGIGRAPRYLLYSVPAAGGSATLLSDDQNGAGGVSQAIFTPDSERVVFTADPTEPYQYQLFSVPLVGGARQDLHTAPTNGGVSATIRLTPDGSRAVYFADQGKGNVDELYSVPVTGGSPVRLNGPLAVGGAVTAFAVGADSQRVLYLADQNLDYFFELFETRVDGGDSVSLTPNLANNRDVTTFALSPDGGCVVYLADQDLVEVYELYSLALESDLPRLEVRSTTTNTVAVTWPSPSTGWTLQQNTNGVSSVNWSNVTSGILDNGTTKTLIVNPPTGNRFYRLTQ